MLLRFKSLARPRRAAKILQAHIPGMTLVESQGVIASMCGYKDWASLRLACESPGAQPSPDDEDLELEALALRREFQAQGVRSVLQNTLVQAQRIVYLASPTLRHPPAAEPTPRDRPLRGAAISMPPLGVRFEANYPTLFCVLYDVNWMRMSFVQREASAVSHPHLISEISLRFKSGRQLTIAGAYLWRFRDSIPTDLLDERGAVLSPNPYTHDSVADMLERIRIAHDSCFMHVDPDQMEVPPLWVDIDMCEARVIRRDPVVLPELRKAQIRALFMKHALGQRETLQSIVDAFVVRSITGPRVELKYVKKGGRGSTAFGPDYVKSSWAGTGSWLFEDLMRERSPERENGCGPNLLYSELFLKELEEPATKIMLEVCRDIARVESFVQALGKELELPRETFCAPSKPRPGKRVKPLIDQWAAALHSALMANSFAKEFPVWLLEELSLAQAERTFQSWNPRLRPDPACRPQVE